VYIPLVQGYIQTCVDQNCPANGDLLSTNVYAAAFNAAVLQGNQALEAGVNKYDTNRANLCGSSQQQANNDYANAQNQYNIVLNNFQTTNALLENMQYCTNPASWDLLLPGQSWPVVTGQTHPIGEWYIPGCSMADFYALGSLVPPPLNCTGLPACDAGCGVDASALQGISHQASCETEWYVHTTILQTVCTAVVFIFWHVCRILVVEGLVRIYWTKLKQGPGLNYYASCNKEGQIDRDTEDQLQVAIKESDAGYRRRGRIYVLLSILLNIPYIVFCVELNLNTQYPYVG